MAHQKIKRSALQQTDAFSPTNHPGDVGFSFAASSVAKKQFPGTIFILSFSSWEVSVPGEIAPKCFISSLEAFAPVSEISGNRHEA